jgi:hypothetical protein
MHEPRISLGRPHHPVHVFFMRGLFLNLLVSSSPGAADLELSPSGPLKTPQAALEAARATEKPVRIFVADGTYAMAEPLVFGPEDSGVTWEAAPGAKPVFTGGREITGWTGSKSIHAWLEHPGGGLLTPFRETLPRPFADRAFGTPVPSSRTGP